MAFAARLVRSARPMVASPAARSSATAVVRGLPALPTTLRPRAADAWPAGGLVAAPASLGAVRFGRTVAEARDDGTSTIVHFRESLQPHPLLAKPHQRKEHDGKHPMTLNHIWSKKEIDERLESLWQHKPETRSDRIMHGLMYGLYRGFNLITGYKPVNTPVKAVEWRLIVLESFAGVPGFLAAIFRHFRSLRSLHRDHGWIHTLLEEAENERMHLLVCMRMFEAGLVTRFLVVSAQVCMTPFLAALYVVKPGAVHRFVGYLEETACHTYANIIKQVETPGTPLHEAWHGLQAPQMAKVYWKLPEDARWVDALKCMFADECNHRDVNHTFAGMETDDPNPFVEKHKEDAIHAWRLQQHGGTTDVGCSESDLKSRSRATSVKPGEGEPLAGL